MPVHAAAAPASANRRQHDRRRPWWLPGLFERFSIGVQVATFVVLLALVVVGLSYRAYVTSAQDLVRQAESERLQGAAHVAQARIEAESRVLTTSSQALARHPAVRQALDGHGAQALAAARLEFDRAHGRAGFSMLHLIDRSRAIVHRAAQPGLPSGKAAVWGISEALAGESVLQTTKEASGGLVIRSMVPVRSGGFSGDDSVVGVVMAGTRFDDGFAQRIGADGGGVELAFATPTGVVARSSARFASSAELHQKFIEAALFERRPVLDFDLDRAALRQYVPVKLGDEAFVLIVQGDAAAAQARVVFAARQALQTSVALLGLATVAASLFALALARRLRRVGAQAQALARDITGTDVAPGGPRGTATPALRSELAELEQVFDRTALAVARHHEELHRAKERAEYAANYDGLTGLVNRAFLLRRLAAEMAHQPGADWALLFLDLDGFKQVNDRLGHGAGDALLREAASRLCALVDSRDDVARLGGDEFVIMARCPPDARGSQPPTETEVLALAQRLAHAAIAALEQPFQVDAEQGAAVWVSVSASIGIALHPSHGQDPAQLLKRADMALYAAKHAGRRTCRVYGRQGDAQMGGLSLVA